MRPAWGRCARISDIVDALSARSNGTAHVRELARELWRGHDINEIEPTITRTINNYCSDAQDLHKAVRFDLFSRVAPATYRLRDFPKKPNVLEFQRIEFEDAAMQSTWEYFSRLASKSENWVAASKGKKLLAFSRYVSKEPGLSIYAQTKELFAQPINLADLGLYLARKKLKLVRPERED